MQFDTFDIVITLAAAALCWWILSIRGVFGGNKAAKKAIEDKRSMQSIQRKRKAMTWLMGQFESFAMRVGGGISPSAQTELDYVIQRKELMVKTLGRLWKPIELTGLFRMLGFFGCLVTAIGITRWSFNPLWFGFLLVFIKKGFLMMIEAQLQDEDKELEQDFPTLYLMLCPKLQMGANARIATVLQDYMLSLEYTYSKSEHLAIKKFTRMLRNNIELYSDEVLALTKIRNLYKSAMIINFCNIAIQSMNGVDNKDKLLSFESELTTQQLNYMRAVQEKRIAKAEKATLAIYVILFEFVILSMVSRLGGSFDNLFNLI